MQLQSNPQSVNSGSSGQNIIISLNIICKFFKDFYEGFGHKLKNVDLNQVIYINYDYNYFMFIEYEYEYQNNYLFGDAEVLIVTGINKKMEENFNKKEDYKKHDIEFKGHFEIDDLLNIKVENQKLEKN